MNNGIKRRLYAAPTAELICLAPAAPVATWKWEGKGSNSKWSQNSWSANGVPTDLFGLASATGIAEWAGEDELKAD